jgi:hypothetical protein
MVPTLMVAWRLICGAIVVTVIVVPLFVFCSSVAKGVGRGGKVDK